MANILVVDDDAQVREVVEVTLAEHECTPASSGEEALELLETGSFHAVVLDVMMPGLDGISTLRAIRRDPRWRDLPVVMLTARAGEHDHLLGYECGADGYLTKPFDIDELITTVEAVQHSTPEQRAKRRDEELARAALLRQVEMRFA